MLLLHQFFMIFRILLQYFKFFFCEFLNIRHLRSYIFGRMIVHIFSIESSSRCYDGSRHPQSCMYFVLLTSDQSNILLTLVGTALALSKKLSYGMRWLVSQQYETLSWITIELEEDTVLTFPLPILRNFQSSFLSDNLT